MQFNKACFWLAYLDRLVGNKNDKFLKLQMLVSKPKDSMFLSFIFNLRHVINHKFTYK